MRKVTRYAVVAVLAVGVVVPVIVGCNLLQYQFCINNLTSYDLKEVNIAEQGAVSWGANDLSGTIVPGGSQDIKWFLPGTYMARAVFDVADPSELCDGKDVVNNEFIYVLEGLEITTTNICIDYDETYPTKSDKLCVDIYGEPRFAI